jgi:hypothetical protein
MTTYNWTTLVNGGTIPVSGDWATVADWTTNGTAAATAPNDPTADVVIDSAAALTNSYTVAIGGGESFTVHSLTLNDTTADITGTNAQPYDAATLELDGTLAFAPGSPGLLAGSPQTRIQVAPGANAEIINAGTINGYVQAEGNLLLTGTNGVYFTNDVQALSGTVTVDTSAIAEINGHALFDGSFEASGAGAVVDLGGALGGLVVNIGTVEGPAGQAGYTNLAFTGQGSEINQWNGTAYVSVETSLTDIAGGGVVDVLGGADYTTAQTLTVNAGTGGANPGELQVEGGTFTAAGIVNAGGIVQGFGTFVGGLQNAGTVMAVGGTLDLAGSVTGTGVIDFDYDLLAGTLSATGATLEVNRVTAGQTIAMTGRDTLQLDTPAAFAGTIEAKAGDKIVLTGLTATSAVLTNGTLTVSDGATVVDTLLLAGSYAGDVFDASGSTITIAAASTVVPTISGTSAGQATSDAAAIKPFSKVVIADLNAGATDTVTVTLSAAANGTLTNLGGGSYNATTGVYTDTGSAAALTTALDELVFTPTLHQVAPGGSVTTHFTINDSDTAGTSASDSTTSVIATAAASPGAPAALSSDILFQNQSGQIAQWMVSGTSIAGGAAIGSDPGPSWFAMGTGAFYTGDTSDIVWQNQDGSVALWQVQANNVVGGGVVADNPGTTWHIKGTGNFYGDGNTDILWQNDDGSVALWDMQGSTIVQGGIVGSNPGPTWHVEGTGDFYGDGNTDIVWQNDDGSVALWDVNGTSIVQGGIVASNPGTTWHIKGTGDFYGDGNTDILWQNDNGSVAIWDMHGSTIVQGGIVASNPGPTWHVEAVGDFNNDGKTDIAWQNDDGSVAVWNMNGTDIVSGSVLSNPGTSWSVLGGADNMRFIYSGPGGETLAATPTTPDEFVFTNAAAGAHTIAGFNPTQDMIELSSAQFGSFADVQAATTATAAGALIQLGNSSSLLLAGLDAGSLHASNFALA